VNRSTATGNASTPRGSDLRPHTGRRKWAGRTARIGEAIRLVAFPDVEIRVGDVLA
jgi:hypothetical protein